MTWLFLACTTRELKDCSYNFLWACVLHPPWAMSTASCWNLTFVECEIQLRKKKILHMKIPVTVHDKCYDRIHNVEYVLNSIHWKAISLFTLTSPTPKYIDSWLDYYLLLVHTVVLNCRVVWGLFSSMHLLRVDDVLTSC